MSKDFTVVKYIYFPKKYVRVSEGADLFSMGETKFREICRDSHAYHKIGGVTLVNVETIDEYLELFRE